MISQTFSCSETIWNVALPLSSLSTVPKRPGAGRSVTPVLYTSPQLEREILRSLLYNRLSSHSHPLYACIEENSKHAVIFLSIKFKAQLYSTDEVVEMFCNHYSCALMLQKNCSESLLLAV